MKADKNLLWQTEIYRGSFFVRFVGNLNEIYSLFFLSY